MKQKCNAVLEGGGVKGIGHVGAVHALEKSGYEFEQVAGSSAGAIVASLIAAGYSGDEMHEIMGSVDYLKFRQEDILDHFGTIGKIFSVLLDFGIYSANYLEHWLNDLLAKKHCTCFGDVKNADGTYRLQVTTCDITTQELLVLPKDLERFHIDIDSFPIARAVRMSMSIPIFYEPYKLKDIQGVVHYMVDGGMLANYPIWILDDGTSVPKIPTFGLKFMSEQEEGKKEEKRCTNIIDYSKLIVSTLLDANDNYHISRSKGDFARSILISSLVYSDGKKMNISTTDFDITPEQCNALYHNGWYAAKQFLKTWNFEEWKHTYRMNITR